MEHSDISKNLKDVNQWTRIVYMVMFAIALYVANVLLWVIIVIQALFSVITGNQNSNLRELGSSLSIYIFQTVKFLTYCSEEKPFPLQDWPEAEVFDGVDQSAEGSDQKPDQSDPLSGNSSSEDSSSEDGSTEDSSTEGTEAASEQSEVSEPESSGKDEKSDDSAKK